MPVQPLGGGRFRWGESGRVYSGPGAREKAERQGRAVLATGWREKSDAGRGSGGADRSAARRGLKASARAEARYVRDLQGILGRIHDGVEKVVAPHLEALSQKADAAGAGAPDLGPTFEKKLFVYVKREVGKAYDRMSGEVAKKAATTHILLGLNPVHAGLGGVVEDARNRNIELVENAGRVYARQVRGIFDDPANFGRRVEDLQKMLEDRAEVSKSRAALIARDQTLKLNAAITKHRQVSAGVNRYTWDTSQDERVRPMHADLQGETYDWDDPPVTNEDGDTNHPGEDYQCRCVPLPVIEDFEDQPEEEEPKEEPEEAALPLAGLEEAEEEPIAKEPAPPEEDEPVDASLAFEVERVAGAAFTTEQVVGGVTEPALVDWLENRPPDRRGGVPKVVLDAAAATPGNEGLFTPSRNEIRVVTKGISPPDEIGARAGSAWRVADTRATLRDKVRASFKHELGHYMHMHAPFGGTVDRIVKEAYSRLNLSTQDIVEIEERRRLSPAISRYAIRNYYEYFAESFNAYLDDRASLQKHDPAGLAMVESVLKELGVAKAR